MPVMTAPLWLQLLSSYHNTFMVAMNRVGQAHG